ncbi:uncharacterized protein LOC113557558 [Rhopalosiphum maidis]|uniref:uncharacterized protein LOC113557558 n=1 Tax=Rhopalosiphum maidis TaxID=43146 RepID=UPI000EFFF364|nr:uncharacterized protein LOC113557558 [Rhopalosiphum maidis]
MVIGLIRGAMRKIQCHMIADSFTKVQDTPDSINYKETDQQMSLKKQYQRDIANLLQTNLSTFQTANSFVNTTVNYLIPSTSYQPNYQHGLHRSKRLRRSNAPEYISAPAVFKNIGNDYDFQRSMTSSKVKKETAEDINLSNWPQRWIEETEYKNALAQANSVINIKVHWRQMGTYRFPLRMFQSLSSVYKHIAKLEGVDPSHVRLYRNQRILSPKDTLDSIKYKITDAIEGDITFLESPKCTTYTALGKEELVTYKITRQAKSPIIVKMRKTDKMSILYIKLKELLGIKLDSFTLKLNGDKVKYSDTMASLGLEGDNNISLE